MLTKTNRLIPGKPLEEDFEEYWQMKNDEYIGYCDFVDKNELLYGLKRSAWDKGYGLETAEAALHYGFAILKLPYIIATVIKEHCF